MSNRRVRPILFSAPMVRALLDGRKTQTRRIMKPQPPDGWFISEDERDEPGHAEWLAERCPYGAPGDRLWVREAVRWEGGPLAIFEADGSACVIDTWPWKRTKLPSIHMPRGASRITLEITEVRVQRLQEIGEEDARAEGVSPVTWSRPINGLLSSYVEGFKTLWGIINGERAPWSSNPFVWSLTFQGVE